MLKVKLLDPDAKAPTVAHPGEDIGYDLYALEDTLLFSWKTTAVSTGIAAAAYRKTFATTEGLIPAGLLIRDRSSMASKGILTHGGVIDAGYRGEIKVLMSVIGLKHDEFYRIKAGDKIAQMVPVAVLTGEVEAVDELQEASRGTRGFGSSGK